MAMQVTDEEEVEDPWEDPEALEALRRYLRVVWRVFERLEREEAEQNLAALPELEPSDTVNEQHTNI